MFMYVQTIFGGYVSNEIYNKVGHKAINKVKNHQYNHKTTVITNYTIQYCCY